MIEYFYKRVDDGLYFGVPRIFTYTKLGPLTHVELMLMDVFSRVGNNYIFSIFGINVFEGRDNSVSFLGMTFNYD